MSENADKQRNKSEIIFRSILALIGVAILAIGATLCKQGNVGLDPFTAINIGISEKIGLSLGITQLLANMFIIVVVLLFDRKKIGIGTIINMVGAGFMIDWFSNFYDILFQYEPTLLTKVVNGILGLLFFTLGTSIYMTAKVGISPYDALAPIASKRLPIKYKFCRITQDILFMVGALIIGGPIGLATIIISFFAGPLITFWDNRFSKVLVANFAKLGKHPSGKRISHSIDNTGKYTYNLIKHSNNQTVATQGKIPNYSDEQVQQMHRTLNDMETALYNTDIQSIKKRTGNAKNQQASAKRRSKHNSNPSKQ